MNGPLVRIRFDGNGGIYRPGDTLSGEYRIESVPANEVKAVEVSVLWYTEGKGDEERGGKVMRAHDGLRRMGLTQTSAAS